MVTQRVEIGGDTLHSRGCCGSGIRALFTGLGFLHLQNLQNKIPFVSDKSLVKVQAKSKAISL
jgi:hypothetical protein